MSALRKMSLRMAIFLCLHAGFRSVTSETEVDWHFKGPNIALNKSTTQYPGTYNDTKKSYSADLAVDGITSSDLSKGSCTHTSVHHLRHNATWEVNLGGKFFVTGINIFNREDYKKRLKGFRVRGFADNQICPDTGWCEIFDDATQSKYSQLKIQIILNGSKPFTKIAIELPTAHYRVLTLCEVQIFAASCKTMNISDGQMIPKQSDYAVHTQVVIRCNTGYKPEEQVIKCNENRKWDTYEFCKEVKCARPEQPEHGYYLPGLHSNSSSLPYDNVITGKCNPGYQNENFENRTCQFNETWSGVAPNCTKIQCPYPKSLANGTYRFRNGSLYQSGLSYYNTTVKIRCNTGYYIVGNEERTCNANQTWSGETRCSLVTCSLPQKPDGGYYEIKDSNGLIIPYHNTITNYSERVFYNTTVKIRCNTGYYAVGNEERTCNANQTWSGETRCTLVTCSLPRKPDGGYYEIKDSNGLIMPYHNTIFNYSERAFYNTTVTLVCDEHFELMSPENRTRRCTEAGVWDKEPALCVKMQTHTERNKAGLIAGILSAGGFTISVMLVALFILYRRRRKLKDHADRSKRYRNANKKIASKIANTTAHDYRDGLHSNDIDISQEGTSREVLDETADDHDRSAEYCNAVPVQIVLSDVSLSSLHPDREYYSFSGTENIPATTIKIQDLSDVTLSGTGAKERFQKEFESLPQGMVEAHTAALNPNNKRKNRYKNLYAYDDTRVILDVEDDHDTDYINACFVHGFNRTRKYIASQGPTKEILNDFWRMIWQTECCKIVMLTNLLEEGTVKCDQYWPSQGSKTYGRITVKMKQTEPFSKFVIRTFTVQKDGSSDRNVTQFHFTAWPDRAVPKYTSSLVQFLNKVKYSPSHGDGPIVVHCSSGVGRTGTFIALDNVTEQGKAMGYIDVAGVVESMRRQRVSAVQTLEQYIFVYQAVAETLMLSSSAVPAAKFAEAYTDLLQTDPRKQKRKLVLEFEALKKVSPVTEEDQYVSCKLERNRNKNRYTHVLSVEEYMPRLTKGDGTEDCEYINAVFLPSYKEEKAFIITKTPLESTVEDFWRLIWEHNVHTLVMMNSHEEMAKSEVYWPNDDQTISFGNISISNNSTTTINKHTVFSLTVKKFVVSRHIKLFQVGGWKSRKPLPESTDVILSLMELVQSWQQQTGNHTILVHCMNGVEKSGLFCVISAVIERMKIEQDVAIPQVIEEMRNAREQIIPSVEQFQFCHEAVLTFIHQYDAYSNFTI